MLLTATSTCETKQKDSNKRGKKVRIEGFIRKFSFCHEQNGQTAQPALICYHKCFLAGNVHADSCLYISVCLWVWEQATDPKPTHFGSVQRLLKVPISLVIYPALNLCFQKRCSRVSLALTANIKYMLWLPGNGEHHVSCYLRCLLQ